MSDLNPLQHGKAYGTMVIGPVRVPGKITDISGADRKWKFDEQKAVGTSGASLNYKGEEIASSIKVKTSLQTISDFVDLAAARRALATPKGQKPVAKDVKNAILNNQVPPIQSVQVKMIGQETETSPGSGQWTVEWELGEYNPPAPTATGAASSSTPAAPGAPTPPAAADAAEQALQSLLQKAAAA